jgi:hypothetical protein
VKKCNLGRALGQRHPGFAERRGLAPRHIGEIGPRNRVLEQPVKIELGVEMQEYAAEPDRGTVGLRVYWAGAMSEVLRSATASINYAWALPTMNLASALTEGC